MTVLWIAAGIGGWLMVAAAVGLALGRLIRRRDRQVPRPAPPTPADRAAKPEASRRTT